MKNYLAEYLANHSLEQLQEDYGIKSNVFVTGKSHDLVCFSYSQIDSPKTDPIVRMSRGLVLEKDTWKIVSYPFYRFFNFEEVLEERLNFHWDKSVATEKIDGSLISYFYYNGSWYMSTRSMIGGENRITTNLYSFKDLFLKSISPLSEEEFQAELNKNWPEGSICFTFELVSNYHQIVHPYQDTKLYLIGARYLGENTNDFQKYQELKFVDVYNMFSSKLKDIILCPKVISLVDDSGKFRGFDEMKALAEAGNAVDEGYVVTDWSNFMPDSMSFPRTKVKNSAYVALHHLRSSIEGDEEGISFHKILNICFKQEQDEFLAVLPQYTDIFKKVQEKWLDFVDYMNAMVSDTKFKELFENSKTENKEKCRKEFALYVKDKKFNSIFFSMYNHNFDSWYSVIEDIIKKKSPDNFFKSLWDNIKN